jgi:hypothetical protein
MGVGPIGHSAGRRVGVRAIFLKSSESDQLCWVSMKCCHVRELSVGSIRVAYVDWHGKCMCRVHLVSLAGCTLIQITMTLEYE